MSDEMTFRTKKLTFSKWQKNGRKKDSVFVWMTVKYSQSEDLAPLRTQSFVLGLSLQAGVD